METVLTLGLVSVILGTGIGGGEHRDCRRDRSRWLCRPSRGLWGVRSRASMNPAHLRPRPRRHRLHELLGLRRRLLVGAALAVGAAWVLRGAGGGRTGSAAAQGDIQTEVEHPEKA